MNVTCTQCGKSIFVMNSLAGKKVKCQCGTIVAVPAAAAPASKPMFKPGSLKLPPKPQLKAGLKLASGITGAPPSKAPAPTPAPAPEAAPAPVAEPAPAPAPEPVAKEEPAAAPAAEPAPAPAHVPEPIPEPVPQVTPAPVQEPAPAPAPASAPEGAVVADLATRLTKLKSLFDMGVISAEEHASQRARILAEI